MFVGKTIPGEPVAHARVPFTGCGWKSNTSGATEYRALLQLILACIYAGKTIKAVLDLAERGHCNGVCGDALAGLASRRDAGLEIRRRAIFFDHALVTVRIAG